ncbi:hypothetical protein Cch01nite_32830 [Cellulomonas chitinilytica]|uniref:Uncharacterized protein n=1 Tax=Cellulomonas chitinilytica TaxID=398759 RepID=A0A919P7W3_9CELL|nr:hypothetical protein [Cellulomonas chitinilytica]GIG22559.1 hypothetical protein Cch01nite_32830 [Cellulomonas chitinilytica]
MAERRRKDLTEFLLTYLGPAQISPVRARGRERTDDERERDERLRVDFERVAGPDGRTFLVERPRPERTRPERTRPERPSDVVE